MKAWPLIFLVCVSCSDGITPVAADQSIREVQDSYIDGVVADAAVPVAWDSAPVADVVDAEQDAPDVEWECEDGIERSCTIAARVGECGVGTEFCRNYQWSECVPVHGPRLERCNGYDDDCDESVDEDLSRACYTGPANTQKVGVCEGGVYACLGHGGYDPVCRGEVLPSDEVCDALDNDCDGSVDEGLRNRCGLCGPPPPERCNFLDDDCDGLIDEGAGACVCGNELYEIQAETCNGIDDDCDEAIDEGPLGGPLTVLCLPALEPDGDIQLVERDQGVGICRAGVSFCDQRRVEGVREYGFFTCDRALGPQPEHCNGIDDDCDGVLDEGFDPIPEDIMVSFVIDLSASMDAQELMAAFNVIQIFLRAAPEPVLARMCFSLFTVGTENQPAIFPGPPLCGTSAQFNAAVADVFPIDPSWDAGAELTINALLMLALDDNFDMDGVNGVETFEWHLNPGRPVQRQDIAFPNRRPAIFILTDERPQWDGNGWPALPEPISELVNRVMRATNALVWIAAPNELIINQFSELMPGYEGFFGTRFNEANGEAIEDSLGQALDDLACLLGPQIER